MVRKFASLAVPFWLLLLLMGILLATFILAVIGFRSVEKEEWIAEKNYETATISLREAVLRVSKAAEEKVVNQVRKLGLSEEYLPNFLPGILSVFIFKDGNLVFPGVHEEEQNEIYLLSDSDALVLKEFLDMQAAEKYDEAANYALKLVDYFFKNPSIARLDWDSYVLEKMLSDILSRKNLSNEEKEKIQTSLKEMKKFLKTLNTYREHRDFLLALGNYMSYSNDGYFFIHNNGKTFLTLSSPELMTKTAIVIEMDSLFYANSIMNVINETAKEWSYIPFKISGNFPFGKWNISIEENFGAIQKELREKIFLLYLLLIFSLIIPMIGVMVVYRVFARERQLLLMKDNFLSTISHELKTPLTSIKMYSEMMSRKPEKIVAYTGIILKETNRLESLIEAILNYTRMESGKKVFHWDNINLSECVNKVCDSLDVIANSKRLELRKEIEENCNITGDYQSIYSLVQNLVENAIKYTAEGYVFVKLCADEHGVSFSVTDSGKGIPVNEQKNIFEGFYRIGDESTRETKGSGLGLAIVKRTADAHKAQITLKSAPGKGAAFTVTFKE